MTQKQYPINANDTIFIALSAFDDMLLFDTVRHCLNQAEYPQLLYFGIVHYSLEKIELPEDLEHHPRIQYINFVTTFGPGVGITRNLTYHLYDNQSYYFQLDSHMYMTTHWDTKILSLYKHIKTKHKRFVISGHMDSFSLDDKKNIVLDENIKKNNWVFEQGEQEIVASKTVQVFLFHKRTSLFTFALKEIESVIQTKTYEEYFMVSGACLFGDKEAVAFIEPDPKIVFGEEPSLFFRLKSNDYKIFRPTNPLLYHYHDTNNSQTKRNTKANFLPLLLKNGKQRIYDTFTGKLLGYWGAKDLTSYQQIIELMIIKK